MCREEYIYLKSSKCSEAIYIYLKHPIANDIYLTYINRKEKGYIYRLNNASVIKKYEDIAIFINRIIYCQNGDDKYFDKKIKKYSSFLKKLYFIKKDIENDSLGLGLSMVVLEYFIDLKDYIYYLIVKFGLQIILNEIRLKIPFYYFLVDIDVYQSKVIVKYQCITEIENKISAELERINEKLNYYFEVARIQTELFINSHFFDLKYSDFVNDICMCEFWLKDTYDSKKN